MNWQAIRFDWNQLRAFLVTAETGSFSAAARALALTQPTLGRQVAALEDTLGVVLFERVGRSLILTDSGLALLEHARAMGESAVRASLSAAGHAQAIDGQVAVSAGDMLALRVLPPIVARLRTLAPQVHVEVISSNALSDLQRREADIAIRHVRPEQPDLITRLVRESPVRLYAAKSYLDRVGRPDSRADLARLDYISMGEAEQTVQVLQRFGIPCQPERTRIGSEVGAICWELMKLGQGVLPMMSDLVDGVQGIEPVLPDFVPLTAPYWLTVHRELHTSRRIRLVYDALADALSQKVLVTV